jgi:sorbitol/mannitol transport system substrate-binding protein
MRRQLLLCSAILLAASSAEAAEINIATVNNPDMITMQKLSAEFMKAHPDIKVNFVVLPDNVLRQNVTQDVAVKGGRYDIATISPYEVQAGWAENGWPTISTTCCRRSAPR